MKSNLKFFKNLKSIPIDNFFSNVLYNKKFGYYSNVYPFGKKGDFITAPTLSKLFSEIISIWIVSTWEVLGKPKNINIVELGPGDVSLVKILLETSKKFPKFDLAKKIYLYESNNLLKNIQKKNIKNNQVKWLKDFSKIKNGPVIFFGNEFFDSIPIKQFKRTKNTIFEKYFILKKNTKILETFKKAKQSDIDIIKSYKVLKQLKFIEFPKSGLKILEKVAKTISRQNGCVLMIDYGYLKPNNQNTLQSVMNNKKNNLLSNLGKADITYHVNFSLLKEFFLKKNLVTNRVVTQEKFLKNMGIIERAEMLSSKMKFKEQTNLYLRLKRLISPKLMGELFKVILAFKSEKDKYLGFN